MSSAPAWRRTTSVSPTSRWRPVVKSGPAGAAPESRARKIDSVSRRARGGAAATSAVVATTSPGPGFALARATRAVSRRRKFTYANSNAVRSIEKPAAFAARTMCPCASIQAVVGLPPDRSSIRKARIVSKCTATQAMVVESKPALSGTTKVDSAATVTSTGRCASSMGSKTALA